jgi:hypothetical protein
MLEEIINYVQSLQQQVEVSDRRVPPNAWSHPIIRSIISYSP